MTAGLLGSFRNSLSLYFSSFTDSIGKRNDKVKNLLLGSTRLPHGFCPISLLSLLFPSSSRAAFGEQSDSGLQGRRIFVLPSVNSKRSLNAYCAPDTALARSTAGKPAMALGLWHQYTWEHICRHTVCVRPWDYGASVYGNTRTGTVYINR